MLLCYVEEANDGRRDGQQESGELGPIELGASGCHRLRAES